MLASPVLCEQLTYDFNPGVSDNRCFIGNLVSGKDEDKRREVILKYGLDRSLRWKYGVTRNEWGDWKDEFCYLKQGGTYYLWFPFHPFWQSDPPIRIVK